MEFSHVVALPSLRAAPPEQAEAVRLVARAEADAPENGTDSLCNIVCSEGPKTGHIGTSSRNTGRMDVEAETNEKPPQNGGFSGLNGWYPGRGSNPDLQLRRLPPYPLGYRGLTRETIGPPRRVSRKRGHRNRPAKKGGDPSAGFRRWRPFGV